MPKAKTKRGAKPTERQRDIKALLDQKKPISEVAQIMETTPGAIYQQIGRMRKMGFMPPASRRPARAAAAAAPQASAAVKPAEPEAPAPNENRAASNGHSLEEHLDSELGSVVERLRVIEAQQHDLAREGTALQERRERLDAAQKALAPA